MSSYTHYIGQIFRQAKKKKGLARIFAQILPEVLPKFARILPEYYPTFAQIRYIDKKNLWPVGGGGGHSAPLPGCHSPLIRLWGYLV